MADENDQADDIDDQEEGGDDLCDEKTELERHEITGDEELPATTGGVEE
ncbi:MAG TPA: hypothetical protein VES64_10595 [Allosphingosinicella sp.]|nr:hypothetical protein [Allosphingosinicella sp.]